MKKNQLSRRDFLKGAAAGTASLAALGLLGACTAKDGQESDSPAGTYHPGTYAAKAKGMGEIVVTMTFSADAITDVTLDLSNETDSIGQAAGDTLKAALLEKQSAEIDTVSGATITTDAVKKAAEKCIQQAKGRSLWSCSPCPAAALPPWRAVRPPGVPLPRLFPMTRSRRPTMPTLWWWAMATPALTPAAIWPPRG